MRISDLAKSIKSLDGSPDSLRRHLVRGFKGNFILLIIQRSFIFGLAVVLGRLLGAEQLGVYSTAMAVILLASTLVTNGIPLVLLRFVPKYIVNKQWELLRGLWHGLNKIAFISSILLMIILGVGAFLFQSSFEPQSLWPFWIGLLLIPISAMSNLRREMLRSLDHVVLSRVSEIVRPGITLLIIIIIFNIGPYNKLSSSEAMIAQVIAITMSLIIGWLLLVKRFPKDAKKIRVSYEISTWMRSIGPLTLLSVFGIIAAQTDMIMLSALRGAESAGIYRVAERISVLIILGFPIINHVVAPTLSRLYVTEETKKFKRLIRICSVFNLITGVTIMLPIIIWSEEIIHYVFGEEYVRGASALVVLCLGQIIHAPMAMLPTIANISGYEKITARIIGFSAILNIVLNAIFIPIYGLVGAALATSLCLLFWTVWLSLFLYRELGIPPIFINFLKYK